MKKEFVYEAPQVEIVEVAVEKGFASSGDFEIQVTDQKAKSDTDGNWWVL